MRDTSTQHFRLRWYVNFYFVKYIGAVYGRIFWDSGRYPTRLYLDCSNGHLSPTEILVRFQPDRVLIDSGRVQLDGWLFKIINAITDLEMTMTIHSKILQNHNSW